MWWLIGSAPDFWGTQGPGFDQASPTMLRMRCSLFNNVGNVPTPEAKNVLMGQVKPINI